MGSNKFYTYYQFADTLIITIISIIAVAFLVEFYFRRGEVKKIEHINYTLPVILSYLWLKFLETVITNIEYAHEMREKEIVIINFLLMIYIFEIFFSDGKKHILQISIVSIGIIVLIISEWNKIIIKSYAFHNVDYYLYYKVIALVIAIAAIIKSLYMITRIIKSDEKLERLHGAVIVTFILLTYILNIFLTNKNLVYTELLLVLSLLIHWYLTFSIYSKRSNSVLAYSRIGDMSSRCIFVVDSKNQTLYQNQAANKGQFLVNSEDYESSSIIEILNTKKKKVKKLFDDEYIEIKKEEKTYFFRYSENIIKEKEKEIGRIVTIEDSTEKLNLIRKLKNKKKYLDKMNKKLIHYSNLVYYLEKEKEINRIFDKVILTREEEMKELAKSIKNLKENIGVESFEKSLDECIEKTKLILVKIRKTVTEYRNTYGG